MKADIILLSPNIVSLAPTIADVNCVPTEVTVVPDVLTVEVGTNQEEEKYKTVPSCGANAPPFCNILPVTLKLPVALWLSVKRFPITTPAFVT